MPKFTPFKINVSAILIVLGLIGIQSCGVTKYLEEDQYLVRNIRMTLKGPSKTIDNSELRDELQKLYKITPNKNKRKVLNYFKYRDIENPSWPKKWIKNKRTEAPALIEEEEVMASATAIEQYLQNKKGYYQATVDYEINYSENEAKGDIHYIVHTGERYIINDIHHLSKDTSLVETVKNLSKKSLIHQGDPIDALTFDLEKQRIVSELQKIGYADFNLNNVEIQGDSTGLDKAWDIFIIVLPPASSLSHQSYKIGEVKVYTDYHQFQKESDLTAENRYDKNYYKEGDSYVVMPSTIEQKIFFDKYSTYSSDNYYKTLRKLYSLSAYRFAKINSAPNKEDPTLIDYSIFLTPHNKKYILDIGIESFFSTLSIVNTELVGVAVSTGIEDRNAFGGSERLKANVSAGLEFNLNRLAGQGPQQPLVNSQTVGINTELEIPTVTKPFNILRSLNKFKVIKDHQMKKLEEEGSSRLGLGYNFQDIFMFYKRSVINAEYGFDFNLNKKNRLNFNQVGISYNDYTIDQFFRPTLLSNEVLLNSFVDNLFTGLLFKDLTYVHTTERGTNKSNFAFISSLELSGLEVHLANSLSNLVTRKSAVWRLSGGTEFEKMVKLDFETVWYSRKKKLGQLAARIKTGIAIPFGSDNTISYIKQFFVGGPSSIRAWRPMHLGPGTFVNNEFFFPTSETIFFQRGDFNLEMNLEYRFHLAWLMEGALFVDLGNIWTLQEERDPNGNVIRPGSQLSASFLNELAIGYGYGIRFDFNYFLIRFDLGLKLRYPSNEYSQFSGPRIPAPSSRWISPRGQSLGNFNIAVAYPF